MLTRRPDRDGARWELEESLRRLGCDQLDLHQAHGVTGHDLGAPRAHLAAVKRYDLDTVMFPLYPRVWADPVYRADAEALLSYCAERFEPMTDEDRESVIRITSEDELIFPLAEKLRATDEDLFAQTALCSHNRLSPPLMLMAVPVT